MKKLTPCDKAQQQHTQLMLDIRYLAYEVVRILQEKKPKNIWNSSGNKRLGMYNTVCLKYIANHLGVSIDTVANILIYDVITDMAIREKCNQSLVKVDEKRLNKLIEENEDKLIQESIDKKKKGKKKKNK